MDAVNDQAHNYGVNFLANSNQTGNSDGVHIAFSKYGVKNWTAGILNGGGEGGFSINEDGGTGGFGTSRLYIQAGGNVGIGTVSPGQKLDVNGNINSNSWIYGNELFTRDNLYIGYLGDYLSNRLNQSVVTNSQPHFSRIWDDDNSHYVDSNVQSYMSSIQLDGSLTSTAGANYAPNGDIYMPYKGQWLSTALGWNGSTYTNLRGGGGYGQYPSGGCAQPNYISGGPTCSCPVAGTSAHGLGSGTNAGSAINMYLCY